MANIFGRQVVLPLTNKSGGSVAAGDVVIVDTGNDEAFTTTTSGAATTVIGVAQETIANNASGRVLVGGYAALVNVNASVTRGNFGKTHTVAKQATDAGSARIAGTFCRFLKGGTTPSAWVYPVDLAGAALTDPTTTNEDIIIRRSAALTRLGIGNAGGALVSLNSVLAYNSGTSMPANKATGDRFWRTDEGIEYFWDGTRWLSTGLHPLTFGNQQAVAPWSATTALRTSFPHPTKDIYIVDFWASTFVSTTNSGTQYWTIGLDGSVTLSTISNAANAVVLESSAVNGVFTNGAATWLTLTITKVSTPGTLFADPRASYRLIGT